MRRASQGQAKQPQPGARAAGGRLSAAARMADYLCVERSAMSAVLSKLREEGVLEVERNRFRLKQLPR